jgi:hypothetical protein
MHGRYSTHGRHIDRRTYVCLLEIRGQSKSSFVLLTLAIPAMFTKFLPKTWTVNSGEPLELSCQLSKPNARVVWLKDGLPLGDRGLAKNEGLRYSLCVPHGVEPGRYTIRIDDADGQESTCQVSVEGMSAVCHRIKRHTFLCFLSQISLKMNERNLALSELSKISRSKRAAHWNSSVNSKATTWKQLGSSMALCFVPTFSPPSISNPINWHILQ